MAESLLVLVRHGESQWNALHKWTGWTDIPLTDKGRQEAKDAAGMLVGIHFDIAFTSLLIRAQETLTIMLSQLEASKIPVVKDGAFNERNYGIYTGKNKLEIKKEIGEDEFTKLRRGWDYPVPQGENLKQVHARVMPYFERVVMPKLKEGKNVLIVAHGNSLRALVKDLDAVADADIANVELATGEVLLYHIDVASGKVLSKERQILPA